MDVPLSSVTGCLSRDEVDLRSTGIMQVNTTTRVSVPWKLVLFTPMAAAFAVLVLASRQAELHHEIGLATIGNLLVALGIAMQGVYWIIVRKSNGIGIMAVVIGSLLFGFALHTLLRTFGL